MRDRQRLSQTLMGIWLVRLPLGHTRTARRSCSSGIGEAHLIGKRQRGTRLLRLPGRKLFKVDFSSPPHLPIKFCTSSLFFVVMVAVMDAPKTTLMLIA